MVEWGGAKIGFTEITGLEVATDVIEYRDGASPEYHKIKMPVMQKFSNITMKRGTFQGDNDYFKWWNTVALNTIERRDLTISLRDLVLKRGMFIGSGIVLWCQNAFENFVFEPVNITIAMLNDSHVLVQAWYVEMQFRKNGP